MKKGYEQRDLRQELETLLTIALKSFLMKTSKVRQIGLCRCLKNSAMLQSPVYDEQSIPLYVHVATHDRWT